MILEDNPAHASFFGQACKVDGVDGARQAIGIRMRMDVDYTAQTGLTLRRWCQESQTKEQLQQSWLHS